MNAREKWTHAMMILAVGAVGLAFTVKMSAQVKTSTEERAGQATQQVQVERGTVLAVSGNDVVVQMADGSIRNVENVPESARVTVDGREIGVHELKPGMHLQKTITTTTTPKVIVTTKTVTGKVWHVTPPNSVILTLEDNTNQAFKIPNGQKFMVNGQPTDAFGLKKGMVVQVTKVVEQPAVQVEEQAKLHGRMPPPPPPAPDLPVLVVMAAPTPAPAPAPVQTAAAELPKTGSELPLTGLIGMMLMAGSAGVKFLRRK